MDVYTVIGSSAQSGVFQGLSERLDDMLHSAKCITCLLGYVDIKYVVKDDKNVKTVEAPCIVYIYIYYTLNFYILHLIFYI